MKNNALNFYRIAFTILIILLHSVDLIGGNEWMIRFGISVEFFFILSGYFLYRSFTAEETHGMTSYVKKRISRLMPEYALAFVLILFAHFFVGDVYFAKATSEFLGLQSVGIFNYSHYNYPAWFVSSLLVASVLVYGALASMKKQFLYVIAPLTLILGYTHLVTTGFQSWTVVEGISMPLLRGVCGVILGVYVGVATEKDFLKNVHPILVTIAEILLLVVVGMSLSTTLSDDMMTTISLALLIYVTASNKGYLTKLLDRKCFAFLSRYAYSAYLNQAFVISLLLNVNESVWEIPFALRPVLIFTGIILLSVGSYHFISFLRSRFKHE